MIDGVIYEVCTGKRVKVTWEGGRTVDALPKRTFPPAFHSGHAGNVSLVEVCVCCVFHMSQRM